MPVKPQKSSRDQRGVDDDDEGEDVPPQIIYPATPSQQMQMQAPPQQPYRPPEDEGDSVGCIESLVIGLSFLLWLLFFPITIWSSIQVIYEYERAVIFRMGRIKKGKAAGPGAFFILPCTDGFRKVDLRTCAYDVPPQQVLTKDSLSIFVDAVMFYRVYDPKIALLNVGNYMASTHLLAASMLRNVLGVKTLTEILNDREGIANVLQSTLDEATDPWGVKVERVEITDVKLPESMQRAMAHEAEAAREAQAKIVAAQGEMEASKVLKGASDSLNSAGALQLRYLQTMSNIAQEKQSLIVFPLPLEMLNTF